MVFEKGKSKYYNNIGETGTNCNTSNIANYMTIYNVPEIAAVSLSRAAAHKAS
jgi:hypothetical protein